MSHQNKILSLMYSELAVDYFKHLLFMSYIKRTFCHFKFPCIFILFFLTFVSFQHTNSFKISCIKQYRPWARWQGICVHCLLFLRSQQGQMRLILLLSFIQNYFIWRFSYFMVNSIFPQCLLYCMYIFSANCTSPIIADKSFTEEETSR